MLPLAQVQECKYGCNHDLTGVAQENIEIAFQAIKLYNVHQLRFSQK